MGYKGCHIITYCLPQISRYFVSNCKYQGEVCRTTKICNVLCVEGVGKKMDGTLSDGEVDGEYPYPSAEAVWTKCKAPGATADTEPHAPARLTRRRDASGAPPRPAAIHIL